MLEVDALAVEQYTHPLPDWGSATQIVQMVILSCGPMEEHNWGDTVDRHTGWEGQCARVHVWRDWAQQIHIVFVYIWL